MNPTVGTTLQGGKYILDQAVGGVRSLTFKATQTQQNRSVILKTLNPQAPSDPAGLPQPLDRQWMEKIRNLSQCRHPALATVLDWFEEGGWTFGVMDYVPGQSLGDRVTLRGALPEAEALQYVRQVGSALSLLHRQGWVHQDVKPENLIQPSGANLVVLVDFGLSGLVGTPGFSGQEYAAIEQFRSQETPTPATDIYALAASLYFVLTGQPPIAAPLRHHTPLVPPRQLQPQISPVVEAAILSGMAVQAALRPQTIAAWFSLLDGKTAMLNGAVLSQAAIELPLLNVPPSNGSSPPVTSPPVTSPPVEPSVAPTLPAGVSGNQPPPLVPQIAPQRPPRRRFPRAFVVGSVLAGSIGIGIGLVLRVSGGTGPGSSFFHTEQAFPKLKDSTDSATSENQQKAEQKGTPAASDLPVSRPYTPTPPTPRRRLPAVDRSVPAPSEPLPIETKSSPNPVAEDAAPSVRSSPPENSAPSAPAAPPEPTEPAPPPLAPASPAPAAIPPPPELPTVRQRQG